jgi:hypothetical protein
MYTPCAGFKMYTPYPGAGVLSQMTIYTCPMETSFQQTMYNCTIKTGMYNIWQLSGGCL